MNKKYILGLHIGHDATTALIDMEGNVLSAMAEERITRIKFHMGFPYDGIDEVLKMAGVQKSEIAYVVGSTKRQLFVGTDEYNNLFTTRDKKTIKGTDIFNDAKSPSISRVLKLISQKFTTPKITDRAKFLSESEQLTLNTLRKICTEIGLEHAEVFTYNHHLCHAASAYYYSGETDAIVFTMDGAGDGDCATVSLAEHGRLNTVASFSDAISPGRFYSEITGFLGFKRLRHEGKLTGLAAYGNASKYYNDLKQYISFDEKKELFVYKQNTANSLSKKINTIKKVYEGKITSIPHTVAIHDFLVSKYDPKTDMQDLAAAAQKILEDVSISFIKHYLKKYPKKKVLLAGGVFANVKLNQFIAEIPGVEFVYIHQNMGDGGLALGGAALHAATIQNKHICKKPADVYWGNGYTNEEIEKELKKENIQYEYVPDIEIKIAQLMADNKVIGRFYGGMEYGPRALGNRSIIGSTTDRTINDWLNKKLKRTEFMPFAPSMIGDLAEDVLEGYNKHISSYTDRFMTITYNVAPKWREKLQATTHVDGTARPQVVFEENNPEYYKIIKEYYKITGIPAVMNTSFNMHEEPIVRTPYDAIRAFRQGCMDYLAIGNYLCKTP
ncbi:MAG: carbamoyltransferase C-terminal domain-containing protein [Chitinophagales bacterium]